MKKLLYIGVSGLLFLVISITFFSIASSNEGSNQSESTPPNTPNPDADSPADTIKTLTATVTSLTRDLEEIKRENTSLLLERENFESRVATFEQRITNQVTSDRERQLAREQRLLDGLDSLSERLDHMTGNDWGSYSTPNNPYSIGNPFPSTTLEWQWLSPLESQDSTSISTTATQSIHPHITLPQNATLIGASTLTALIGRVPIENRVIDPVPIKVITGAHNLAANGHYIEGLIGSIWRGHAIGDWTLSCVTASLTSVTFVFEDGRISTTGTNEANSESIAWLSDDLGMPCIPGERKSNMKSWLAAQVATSFVQGISSATALAETSVQNNLLGTLQSQVDGDLAQYLLGQSISGGSSALSNWITQRADEEFDAVVVPSAQKVAIHVDQPIHIDYDQEGRKLNYDSETHALVSHQLH